MICPPMTGSNGRSEGRSGDSVSVAKRANPVTAGSRQHNTDALQHAGSDRHYIEQLHRGGYATDPDYADKIINIMRQPTLNNALAALNVSQPVLG